jgi:uncharacterized protein (TIGR03067 family)
MIATVPVVAKSLVIEVGSCGQRRSCPTQLLSFPLRPSSADANYGKLPTMKARILTLCIFGICWAAEAKTSTAFEPDDAKTADTQKKDLKLLQGEWTLVTKENRHEHWTSKTSPGTFSGTLLIKAQSAVSKTDFQGEMVEYSFRLVLNPKQNPKEWDEIVATARENGEVFPLKGTIKSVYEVKGDTLIICTSGGFGLPRPRNFNDGQYYVWKRKNNKPGDDAEGSEKPAASGSDQGLKIQRDDDTRRPEGELQDDSGRKENQKSAQQRMADGENQGSKGKLLAHLRFDGNARDLKSSDPTFFFTNTELRDGSLYLNGHYELGECVEGYLAMFAAPDLDFSQFAVAIRFKAEEFGPGKTNILTGGTKGRWFGMHRSPDGNLTVTLNNQQFSHEIKNAPIPAGKWTVVACGLGLSARKILVYLNGKQAATIDIPNNLKLRPFESGFGDADKIWSFTNYSNGNVFHGLVDELLIYGRMLSKEEFANIPLRP